MIEPKRTRVTTMTVTLETPWRVGDYVRIGNVWYTILKDATLAPRR